VVNKITYKDAGVDTFEGARAVELMKESVRGTFGSEVLTGLGSFGSLFKPDLTGIRTPVLVAGTDGVGTKLKIAILADRHDTVGRDLVAMCANDVLCQGARPLFFLDYIATDRVKAEKIADIVRGVSDGCKLAGCALVGGETAEMPGFYAGGDYDMAGFCVGMVDEDDIVDGSGVSEGDLLIGVPSSGLHSNGYSLVRRLFFDELGLGVHDIVEGLDAPLGRELLTPTRIYTKQVMAVLARVRPKAMIHVTGGGFFENIPRVLPDGLGARVTVGSWKVPKIFEVVARRGNIDAKEMFSTFNMGIGFIFVVAASDREVTLNALSAAGEVGAGVVGKIVRGGGVTLAGSGEDIVVDGSGA
jgi:phosphoribosylformylglycinamidine cyclo-ligase